MTLRLITQNDFFLYSTKWVNDILYIFIALYVHVVKSGFIFNDSLFEFCIAVY